MLILKASVILFILLSFRTPINSINLDLSMVLICSIKAIDSLSKLELLIFVWVGKFFLFSRVVIGTTMIVGLYRLPISFWTITTGLIPPCRNLFVRICHLPSCCGSFYCFLSNRQKESAQSVFTDWTLSPLSMPVVGIVEYSVSLLMPPFGNSYYHFSRWNN